MNAFKNSTPLLQLKGVMVDRDKIPQDSYLRGIEALSSLNYLDLTNPVTFFVGENGSGKSTLLEAIAVAYGFNPEGGTINYNFATRDSHSDLWKALSLIRGERRMKSNGNGYFLRAESFYNVARAGGQFIIATHSPIMLSIPGAEILSFDSNKIHKVNYEDTGCYRITEMFIYHRERMLDRLLGEG